MVKSLKKNKDKELSRLGEFYTTAGVGAFFLLVAFLLIEYVGGKLGWGIGLISGLIGGMFVIFSFKLSWEDMKKDERLK